ncbi:TIGR04283 family arsenosugar biosynthesis glycosyltransferase [Acetivibrio ethanolgignens]|uniref:4,4'-diaponeurosporenoate glycosyltransferase n=1 Tax=Acetivibrio ethanolgignens TaxID=290052 RepID=A0A0V8QBD7_9FIRM|nr:TIGR04283 family arsenosugar biosynthesis glycosyltransferase [Acetivibrio ethanolgignens]KSV57802.1 glycosyl transferase [Acetivibrio ethanolgignens]
MKRAIIIFTRVPIPGQTKTRMMPYLTPGQCARLHRCFLIDIGRECKKCASELFVAYTPKDKKEVLRSLLGEAKYFSQQGLGLGDRMLHAIQYVLGKGFDSCVLVGADVPELTSKCLEEAFSVLEKKEVVFGKTVDGGYYLVGMKRPVKEVFSIASYGHSRVLEQAVIELEKKGITSGYTRTLWDMDDRSDLRGYRDRMRRDKRLQQSTTGKYLMRTSKISIIVPIYNEEKTIERLQNQLWPLRGRCEILFVDGGSTDRTLERLSSEFRVLHSEKGRANQMNLGAKESTGDILFFLHCDSELPDRILEQIRYVMKDYRVGCFGIAFHSKNFFMFTCRVLSNHRVKDRRVMFGDQGIFVDRELFFEVGMFPALPIMEDYQFSLTLKERGERPGIAKKRIYTSDRRFPEGTMSKLRVMWKMNRLRKMYRDGVDIEKISCMYHDIR